MKTTLLLTLVLFLTGAPNKLVTYKTDNAHSTMTISGTSTLHDWEMKAKNLEGTMEVDRYPDSIHIKSLNLDVPVNSLKSGKPGMDKNAYDALKEDDHPVIHYDLIKVKNQRKIGGKTIQLTTVGDLTVAGKTRRLSIPIKAQLQADGIAFSGSVSFKMSSFQVEPPSFMFGSVTTGDEITIKFTLEYDQ